MMVCTVQRRREHAEHLGCMQGAVSKNDLQAAKRLLSTIKVCSFLVRSRTMHNCVQDVIEFRSQMLCEMQLKLTQLPALPPQLEKTPTAQNELQLARAPALPVLSPAAQMQYPDSLCDFLLVNMGHDLSLATCRGRSRAGSLPQREVAG